MKEKTALERLAALAPMAHRNLKMALELRPALEQLMNQLGYTPRMSPEEYVDWKTSKNADIVTGIRQLLQENRLPEHQMPAINWLFDASERDIGELKKYCRKPEGAPPQGYHLLCAVAYQFGSPADSAWLEEAGYQTAVLLKHKEGPWDIHGDLWGIPKGVERSLLQKSGDFFVRGNLESFDIASWRRIGKGLSRLKGTSQMGDRLGLVPGGRKGRKKTPKRVLGGRTWPDIRSAVRQDPSLYEPLRSRYALARLAAYDEEYRAGNRGQSAPVNLQQEQIRLARKNFAAQVRRARQE